MGTASTLGSVGAVLAFGGGLLLGLNLGLPFPLSWGAALGIAVVASASTSAAAEIVDLRKRYPVNTFGTHVTRDVYEDERVEDCFSCSGADKDGYRVEWAKDEVAFGMVTERHGGGISYYCQTCHDDPIDAGLRAGHERDFRKRYDGADHYFEVLEDLRMYYLEYDLADDFWEMVDVAMDRVEDHPERDDPRDYVEAVVQYREADGETEFWHDLAEQTGESRSDIRQEFEDSGWFAHIRSRDPFESENAEAKNWEKHEERLAEAEDDLEGLPDHHY